MEDNNTLDYTQQRDCVIAQLQLDIAKVIKETSARPAGLTYIEAVIALTAMTTKWIYRIHKEEIKQEMADARHPLLVSMLRDQDKATGTKGRNTVE